MLTPFPDVRDLVSELLLGIRLNGVQYHRIHVTRPSGLSFGKAPGHAQFRFVGRGPMLLRNASGATMRLEAGDTVLLPQGTPCALLSDPDTPCHEIAGLEPAKICDTVASVGVGVEATPGDVLIFSVCMELNLGGMQLLVDTMPEFMHIGTLPARYPEIHPMLDAMERESCSGHTGFAGILVRLTDVVAVFIVRGWVECGCGDATGWMQALREPKLGLMIVALHRDPERNWSVVELTTQADISRSVFAERSLAATGITPVRYLTGLRMRLATQWITRDREAIKVATCRLSYGSLAAFSRVFKRVVGQPPGAVRVKDAETDT